MSLHDDLLERLVPHSPQARNSRLRPSSASGVRGLGKSEENGRRATVPRDLPFVETMGRRPTVRVRGDSDLPRQSAALSRPSFGEIKDELTVSNRSLP
jgi:hypothetical protein